MPRVCAALTGAVVLLAQAVPSQLWQILDGPPQSWLGLAYDAARSRVVAFGTDGATWEWDGRWRRHPSFTSGPARRGGTRLAYDALRRRVVMVGGTTVAGTPTGEIWEWDGAAWTSPNPTAALPALTGHAMSFDRARARLVVYGGRPGTFPVVAETWEWDGSQWQQRLVPGPTALESSRLVYDEANQVTVLFVQNSNRTPETWSWDGTTWAQRTTPPAIARNGAAMTWDAGRGRVVLHGGRVRLPGGSVANVTDLWEWDGNAWTQVRTRTNLERADHELVYDRRNGRLLAFGGLNPDTWAWDGSAWTRIGDPIPAVPRRDAALVYDPLRSRALLFGGGSMPAPASGASMWIWDGIAWREPPLATSPAPRYGACGFFDAARGVAVFFGGEAYPAGFDDTWSWNGTSWARLTPATSPSPRMLASATYDATRQRGVLIGGMAQGTALGDVWEWDGTTWIERPANPAPPPRYGAGLGFDPVRGRTVLFGGHDTVRPLQDTWEWDGTRWRTFSPATSPPAFLVSALAFDPLRERMLLVGDSLGAWEWDGSAWTAAPGAPPQPPFPGWGFATPRLAFDGGRGRMLLHDGINLQERTPTPVDVIAYGSGCGAPPPVLTARTLPRPGDPEFGLELLGAGPGQLTLFALAAGATAQPLGQSCVLLLQTPLASVFEFADGSGMAVRPIPLPGAPGLRGVVLFGQAAVVDPSAPAGFLLSQGLRVTLGD